MLAILVLASLLALNAAESFSTGKADSARTGCGGAGCHGLPTGTPGFAMVTLEGAPEQYAQGQAYTLTVRVESNAPVLPVAENQGGFALEVSGGTLRTLDDTVQAANGSATHTETGNDQRAWQVEWTAPEGTVDVDWFLSANAVNGNGVQDPGDQWGHIEGVIRAGVPPPPPAGGNATGNATGNDTGAPPPARTPGLGLPEMGLAVAGAAALVARRKR